MRPADAAFGPLPIVCRQQLSICRPHMFLKTALLVLKKDFAIEVKSGEILYTTLFFAVRAS